MNMEWKLIQKDSTLAGKCSGNSKFGREVEIMAKKEEDVLF